MGEGVDFSELDPQQRAAVEAPPGPVCVLAGAGTGKTRTITHRIAHLIATGAHPPDHLLAVTFTTRAAGEMRTRLRSLGAGGVQARTFHAAALRQLRYFWPRSVGGDLWPVLEHKMRFVASVAKRSGAGTDTATLRDLASEIEWAKACLIAPEEYPRRVAELHRDIPFDAGLIAKVYDGYETIKADERQLDFDDLLLHMCAVLENDEDAARQFRSQYRAFVVDEFQDVTPLQHRMMDAWLGGRDGITVVGDANQTIYSFAGASPHYLLNFAQRYPHATVVRLERDYRSTPQVVTLANRVIAAASGAAAALRLTLIAAQPDGPEVTFDEYDDEPAEAAAVARRIAELIREGASPAEIAVLYRINAQSEAYEQALSGAGVPYVVRGGARFFERPEVRQAMTALGRAAQAESEAAGGGVDPADAGGPRVAGPGAVVVNDVPTAGGLEGGAASQGSIALVAAVRTVLEQVGLSAVPPPSGALRDRWDSLMALLSLAEEFAAAGSGATVTQYLAELHQRADAQHAPAAAGVTLASLHAAKGLEWDAVFLVGIVDGTLPIQHADTSAAVEEERRLFYVGITRARTRLAISWALARNSGGRRTRKPSRFLDKIAPRREPTLAGQSRGDRPRRRGPAAIPENADPELVEALRAWRKEEAAEASVPAYVVFSDATLFAIAARRPDSHSALLAIPGIGHSKLERYGDSVVRIVKGS